MQLGNEYVNSTRMVELRSAKSSPQNVPLAYVLYSVGRCAIMQQNPSEGQGLFTAVDFKLYIFSKSTVANNRASFRTRNHSPSSRHSDSIYGHGRDSNKVNHSASECYRTLRHDGGERVITSNCSSISRSSLDLTISPTQSSN